ncbi:hypothetical protein NU219Hw_g8709t1 [Hortaea werneckii]
MSIEPDWKPASSGDHTNNKHKCWDDERIETCNPNGFTANINLGRHSNKTDEMSRQELLVNGEKKFSRLGWKQLTICLIVKAIALGAMSLPSAFANVGMVAGVLLTVGIGLIAIYTSHIIGQVAVKYPHVMHYADAVKLVGGPVGYELCGAMFSCYLTLLVGSHTLTGTIALVRIVDNTTLCALIWGVVSALITFFLALPPSFAEFAVLGYIDFGSIMAALGITIIATGITSDPSTTAWSAWPPEDISFKSAFLSTTNIVLAYAFAVNQFSFMAEMHTRTDYIKSIWCLGILEIIVYTLTGALVYAFVGPEVLSPALLSSGFTVSRVAFGIALPVIFISGSINLTVLGRYVLSRAFPTSPIRYVNTKQGWVAWITLIAVITIISFVIAEAIPFFNALLGLVSSLFLSGFTFYFPSLFWFLLLKEGKWTATWRNIGLTVVNGAVGAIGLALLGLGTWASVQDILDRYASGDVSSSFTCDSTAYA